MKGFFVTGTDTGVGKTLISLALMHRLQHRGLRVAGYKPVASGARATADGLRNEDAELLLAQSNIVVDYDDVNPVCFAPSVAPHLAAQASGKSIDIDHLVARYQALAERCDAVVVEGAGGWRVPLNGDDDIATLAQRIQLPVVFVVAIRLGCLNHALLTARDLARCEVPVAGWIANLVDTTDEFAQGNIDSLRARIAAPCLGVVPRLRDQQGAQSFIAV